MAPKAVIGPLGNVLTLTDLPPPNMLRWSRRRKGEILAAVEGGLLSPEKACAIYHLSMDELLAWRNAVAQFGLAGLRARRPRDPQRSKAGLSLQQFFLTEIERLTTLAHVTGAAPIVSVLEHAAANVRAIQAHQIRTTPSHASAEESTNRCSSFAYPGLLHHHTAGPNT